MVADAEVFEKRGSDALTVATKVLNLVQQAQSDVADMRKNTTQSKAVSGLVAINTAVEEASASEILQDHFAGLIAIDVSKALYEVASYGLEGCCNLAIAPSLLQSC